jgi:hypothetical protein
MPRSCITGSTTPSGGYKNFVRYDVGTLPTDIEEQFDTTTNGSTVLMTVDWADSANFLRDMLGYSVKNGTVLNRILPEKSGWDDDTYAVAARSTKFFGGTTNNPLYQNWPVPLYAEYAVTFAAPLYKVLEDSELSSSTAEYERYCVWRTKGTAQNEKIPGGSLKFVNAEKTLLNEVGVKTGRLVELTCKWIDVPFVDVPRLSSLSNKVNSSAVTWNGATYPAATVLYTGWEVEARNNHFGDPTHDITLTFAIRADNRSWNKFWDKTESGADKYVLVTDNGESGGNPLYQSGDLNTLWGFSS